LWLAPLYRHCIVAHSCPLRRCKTHLHTRAHAQTHKGFHVHALSNPLSLSLSHTHARSQANAPLLTHPSTSAAVYRGLMPIPSGVCQVRSFRGSSSLVSFLAMSIQSCGTHDSCQASTPSESAKRARRLIVQRCTACPAPQRTFVAAQTHPARRCAGLERTRPAGYPAATLLQCLGANCRGEASPTFPAAARTRPRKVCPQ